MSYQALYRKWRPKVFDEVCGQEAIVAAIRNQVKTGKVGHAYLFCGTRGTGKTSAAKIFARAVNCSFSKDNAGNPCNACPNCNLALSGTHLDIIEIDAASNNGVDNIRDIKEQVEYAPAAGDYKVYIIDEVHMLSQGAFNALLKTLEEPPEHVIFILATTDPQKVPQTILSRCQRYDFRRIKKQTIFDRLDYIARAEGVEAQQKALDLIAAKAEGSMRDALSIMDQCLSFRTDEKLEYKDVLASVGTCASEDFSKLFRAIASGDVEKALVTVSEMLSAGKEVEQLIKDFTWHLRNVLLAGKIKDPDETLEISRQETKLLKEDFSLCSEEKIVEMISEFAQLSNRTRFSSQKRVSLEVAVMQACGMNSEKSNPGAEKKAEKDFEEEQVPESKKETEYNKEDNHLDFLRSRWNELLQEADPIARSMYKDPLLDSGNGQIYLCVDSLTKYKWIKNNDRESTLRKIERVCSEKYGVAVSICVREKKEAGKADTVSISEEEMGNRLEALKKIDFDVDIVE